MTAEHSERLWRALGEPARFAPDPKVAELAAAGDLGLRSGRGFYDHPRPAPEVPEAVNEVGPFMELLAQVCPVATTDGRTAAERAGPNGLALLDVAPAPFMDRPSLAFASQGLDAQTRRELRKTGGHEGIALLEVPDTPGLIALRALSVLVNEAGHAAAEGVASWRRSTGRSAGPVLGGRPEAPASLARARAPVHPAGPGGGRRPRRLYAGTGNLLEQNRARWNHLAREFCSTFK